MPMSTHGQVSLKEFTSTIQKTNAKMFFKKFLKNLMLCAVNNSGFIQFL